AEDHAFLTQPLSLPPSLRLAILYAFDSKELRLALPTEKGAPPSLLRIAFSTSGRAGLTEKESNASPACQKQSMHSSNGLTSSTVVETAVIASCSPSAVKARFSRRASIISSFVPTLFPKESTRIAIALYIQQQQTQNSRSIRVTHPLNT
ncbi:hypothetical protein C5S31_00600, partial [ANME-1 cluster archaeon GoMg2]|nr:hypothetical protein [ANME-1 cluster archaeon GoMg2]